MSCRSSWWLCAQSAVKARRPVAEAGQVLPAGTSVGVRVALEVEVQVARVRLRQPQESGSIGGRQQQVGRPPGAALPELFRSLLHQPSSGGVPDAARELGRIGPPKGIEGRNPLRAKRFAVLAAHEGDQREIIIAQPAGRAMRLPAALRTMSDRHRLGLRVIVQEGTQPRPDPARVGGHIQQSPGLLLTIAGNDVQPARCGTLQLPEPVGVHRHLKQRRHLELPGELGVRHLVRPGAEVRRCVDAQQEIGLAAPDAVDQRCLVDHLGTGAHCLDGQLFGSGPSRENVCHSGDVNDRPALLPQPLEVSLLVRRTHGEDEVELVVQRVRGRQHCARNRHVEGRDMRTGNVFGEVGRAEDPLPAYPFHVIPRHSPACREPFGL